MNPVAVVTGVGPGTGAAIARRFAHGGYAVAMLARSRDRLASLEREIVNAHAYQCDVTDEAQLDATIDAIRAELTRQLGCRRPQLSGHRRALGSPPPPPFDAPPQLCQPHRRPHPLTLRAFHSAIPPSVEMTGSLLKGGGAVHARFPKGHKKADLVLTMPEGHKVSVLKFCNCDAT